MSATLRAALLGALIMLVGGASGCASPGSGHSSQAVPNSAEVASPAAMPSGWSAPPVPRRLVAVGVSACQVITTSELIELGLDPDSAEDHSDIADTSDCRWNYAGDELSSVAVILSNVRGLEAVYYFRSTFPYFEPTEVASYPAVRTSSPELTNTCSYSVGIGPNRGLGIAVGGPAGRDYCALARRLVEIVIPKLATE